MSGPTGPTDGLVVVDKPPGLTSHDVVGRIRRLAHTRRVGHAGTLDPMATGVLVVAVGRATRLLTHLLLAEKTYIATIRLGQATSTDDAEGEPTGGHDPSGLTTEAIDRALARFTGSIEQVPSRYSAVKIGGRRAYELARAGEDVELTARAVTVNVFERRSAPRPEAGWLDLEVLVECSSGTYIRALARDVGAALGVGAHLTSLRRLRVGPFRIEQAHTLDQLAELRDPVTLPLAAALPVAMPVRTLSDDEVREVGFGRPVAVYSGGGPGKSTWGGIAADGRAVAVLRDEGERARPVVVFAPAN
ncbi:MAG: tRNA pseudouridine(55) synthase TruB [Actinobacteria bacterium]|nr:tRNA pseudouridine(55) synthase TruB [Actinomycetota bacterium]